MARQRIANLIQDLMIEWASVSPNTSVRDFVINQKSFTPRQYKHIMSRAPAADWKCRREEIQNQISAQKISRHIDEAVEINALYVKASRLSLARSLDHMIKLDPVPERSTQLLNLIKAVEVSQRVFHTAMGIPSGEGLCQIYAQVKESVNQEQHTETKQPGWVDQITYDQILEFIEFRREKKQEAKDLARRSSVAV